MGSGDHKIGARGSVLIPGFGPCCYCEGDVKSPYLIMMEIEAPHGFKGWGCLICHLEARGAIAVFCEKCVLAQRVPIYVAAGRNLADNMRVRLDDKFQQRPFRHDPAAHFIAYKGSRDIPS